MKIALYISLALVSLSLLSCADANKPKQLDQVQALTASLDSLESTLKENFIDTIASMNLTAAQLELHIKQNYFIDTIDMEFGKKMDRFKVMRRQITGMGSLQNKIKHSIDEERESLKKLQTDIDNGSGDRSKYDEYIQFEKDKVGQIDALMTSYLEQRTYIFETFNEIFPELNSFLSELKELKQKK